MDYLEVEGIRYSSVAGPMGITLPAGTSTLTWHVGNTYHTTGSGVEGTQQGFTVCVCDVTSGFRVYIGGNTGYPHCHYTGMKGSVLIGDAVATTCANGGNHISDGSSTGAFTGEAFWFIDPEAPNEMQCAYSSAGGKCTSSCPHGDLNSIIEEMGNSGQLGPPDFGTYPTTGGYMFNDCTSLLNTVGGCDAPYGMFATEQQTYAALCCGTCPTTTIGYAVTPIPTSCAAFTATTCPQGYWGDAAASRCRPCVAPRVASGAAAGATSEAAACYCPAGMWYNVGTEFCVVCDEAAGRGSAGVAGTTSEATGCTQLPFTINTVGAEITPDASGSPMCASDGPLSGGTEYRSNAAAVSAQITAAMSGILYSTEFDVDQAACVASGTACGSSASPTDYLSVKGTKYSEKVGPTGITIAIGDVLEWHVATSTTDPGAGSSKGFTVCLCDVFSSGYRVFAPPPAPVPPPTCTVVGQCTGTSGGGTQWVGEVCANSNSPTQATCTFAGLPSPTSGALFNCAYGAGGGPCATQCTGDQDELVAQYYEYPGLTCAGMLASSPSLCTDSGGEAFAELCCATCAAPVSPPPSQCIAYSATTCPAGYWPDTTAQTCVPCVAPKIAARTTAGALSEIEACAEPVFTVPSGGNLRLDGAMCVTDGFSKDGMGGYRESAVIQKQINIVKAGVLYSNGGVRTTTAHVSSDSSCVDLDANCANWAMSGECYANFGYMGTSCKLACDMCPWPFRIDATASLDGTNFGTAANPTDYIDVKGTRYSGHDGPNNIAVDVGDQITWVVQSVEQTAGPCIGAKCDGWTICLCDVTKNYNAVDPIAGLCNSYTETTCPAGTWGDATTSTCVPCDYDGGRGSKGVAGATSESAACGAFAFSANGMPGVEFMRSRNLPEAQCIKSTQKPSGGYRGATSKVIPMTVATSGVIYTMGQFSTSTFGQYGPGMYGSSQDPSDFLEMPDGAKFTGSVGPNDVAVSAGDTITFKARSNLAFGSCNSEYGDACDGWTICLCGV